MEQTRNGKLTNKRTVLMAAGCMPCRACFPTTMICPAEFFDYTFSVIVSVDIASCCGFDSDDALAGKQRMKNPQFC